MKLRAKKVPYSGIVGGGLMLTTEGGAAAFIVNFMGTTRGITREQSDALAEQIEALINAHGLFVPERAS